LKFSLPHNRVKMWRFFDVSDTNSAPIFTVCWCFGRTKAVLVLLNHQHTLNFGSTKPPTHPEDGDGVISRNVRKPSLLDAAVCQRKFNWILSPQKVQGWNPVYLRPDSTARGPVAERTWAAYSVMQVTQERERTTGV